MKSARPLIHPLGGARLGDLIGIINKHGISRQHIIDGLLMFAASAAQTPLALVETSQVAGRLAQVEFVPAPIFIVGHWRSGTTYLHNLMSQDPNFAFPTMLETLRPSKFLPGPLDFISRRLILRSLSRTRPMDNVPLTIDLPQEDEIALAALGAPSFFNCLYFPQDLKQAFAANVLFEGLPPDEVRNWERKIRYYLAKLSLRKGGRQLLIKNPAHSARIGRLTKLFPGCRFIHLHRHPYDVFASTLKFYQRMIPVVGLQAWNPSSLNDHVLWAYQRLMTVLIESLDRLPADRYLEISYNDLVDSPVTTIEHIYGSFGLKGVNCVRGRISSMVGVGSPSEPIGNAPDPATMAALGSFCTRLGYRPAPILNRAMRLKP